MTTPHPAELTEAERGALWEAIERAFLDTTTWNREAEDEIERAVEVVLAARLATLREGLEALAAKWERLARNGPATYAEIRRAHATDLRAILMPSPRVIASAVDQGDE